MFLAVGSLSIKIQSVRETLSLMDIKNIKMAVDRGAATMLSVSVGMYLQNSHICLQSGPDLVTWCLHKMMLFHLRVNSTPKLLLRRFHTVSENKSSVVQTLIGVVDIAGYDC